MKIFQKIKLFVFAHKIISGIIVIVILFGGYTIYKNSTSTSGETLYTLGTVERGTIISSVDGSGQVSAENQINVTPKVSGTLTYVGVNPGDNVKQGQMLFSLDTTDAEKTVRDAQVSLDNAKLSLQKIQLQDSTENLQTSLDTAYSNSLKDIASTISDSPAILNGLDTILANQNLSDNVVRANGNIGINYRGDAQDTYYKAEMAFQTTRADYASINQNSTPMEIENMLNETLSAEKLLSDAVKSSSTLTDYLSGSTGHPTNYTSLQTSLSGYSSTANSDLSNLMADQTNIQNAKDATPSASLDLQSSQLSVQQAQNALQDAKDNLADYYVYAPFDGVMAVVDGNVGDNVGSSTTLGTIVTTNQTAVISLNEVDAAKISLGEKATLTFDALPDLTVAGQVTEIDTIGTVSQGVVSYNVKISFATEDNRVKPGMTVNAAIITKVEQNVLTIPNSAIKTQGTTSYVQMFDTALPAPLPGVQGSPSAVPPRNQIVQVGITDGTSTEILSGLKEGDKIVTKTVVGSSSASSATAASAPSLFGGGASRGGAAGATRGVRIGG